MSLNRNTKRTFSLLVLVFFILTSSIFTPIMQAFAQEKKTLIIHYAKDPASTDDWNLWVWPNKGDGKAYPFTETDDYGQVARITFETEEQKFGFIVRTDSWKKDVADDRFITKFDAKGTAEIWLKAGDPKIYYSKPSNDKGPSKLNETTQVTVHYKRYDNKYDGWNLWFWPDGKEGASFKFTEEDSFGKVARFTLSGTKDKEKLGLIVRQSVSGNDWQAKEGSEDRFISTFKKDGSVEVWIVQGDSTLYYSEDDVDTTPELLGASLDGFSEITIESKAPMVYIEVGDNGFIVTDKNGNILKLKQVEKLDNIGTDIGRSFRLILENPVDLNDSLKVRKDGYNTLSVTMGQVMSSEEFNNKFYYDKNDLGNIYSKEKTSFRVWAPTAAEAKVVIYDKWDDKTGTETDLQKGEKGTWFAEVAGDLDGKFYNYKVKIGDSWEEAVDPYVRSAAVNGNRGAIIDMKKTTPSNWKPANKPAFKNVTDAVIYELHVRDLSVHPSSGIKDKGKFLGLTEKGTKDPKGNPTGLDYIKNLGVTHVQLLPIYDYATVDETNPDDAFNWGYDPKNYNVPEGSYSTDPYNPYSRVTELKQTVQTLHDNGLRVIMDVVYNHVYSAEAHSFHKLVPGYFFRYNEDGSYSNGSGCGNDVASERAMASKYIVDSVIYWAKEYNLDGFRFDLMGLLDIETMNKVREELNKIDPSIIIIGEGWNMGTRLEESRRAAQINASKLPGIAHFNDTLRDGLKGSVFNIEETAFVNGKPNSDLNVRKGIVGAIDYSDEIKDWGGVEPYQSVSYVEAHDNNTLWDKLELSNPNDSEEDRKAMHRLANAIVLTSQGVAFIHAGQEFLRTKDGDENSYKSPDSVNQLDWDRASANKDTINYVKGLIQLRKEHPAFRMMTSQAVKDNLKFVDAPENVIAYNLGNNANGDKWQDIFLAFNANKEEQVVKLPKSGTWKMVVNKEQAGTKTIQTIKGDTVTVPALGAVVLYSGSSSGSYMWIIAVVIAAVAGGAAYFFNKKLKLRK
jgi:pullulanase